MLSAVAANRTMSGFEHRMINEEVPAEEARNVVGLDECERQNFNKSVFKICV